MEQSQKPCDGQCQDMCSTSAEKAPQSLGESEDFHGVELHVDLKVEKTNDASFDCSTASNHEEDRQSPPSTPSISPAIPRILVKSPGTTDESCSPDRLQERTGGSSSGHCHYGRRSGRLRSLSASPSQASMSTSTFREVWTQLARPEPLPPMPPSFRCPCCNNIMADPVVAADGMTFERACITSWFQLGTMVSPVTGQRLESVTLFPDNRLREATKDYMKLRDHIKSQRTQWFECLANQEMKLSRTFARKEKQISAFKSLLDRGGSSSSRKIRAEGRRHTVGTEVAATPAPLSSQAPSFSAGAAPRIACPCPASCGPPDVKLMREQQRRDMMGKGQWWTRILCR